MIDFKETSYWNIYKAVFDLHKKNIEVQEDESYWNQLVNDIDSIYNKYKNTPEKQFVKDLVLALAAELERKFYACSNVSKKEK